MYYFDPTYMYFALPGFLLAVIAQILVKVRYNKYSDIPSGKGITGMDAANILKEKENFPVEIQTTNGKLNDYFDPRNDTVNISSDNVSNGSVSNIAVVAHEFGHVQQKFTSSFIFKLRTFIVPIINIGSNLGYILFFIGLLINALNLAEIGLVLFAGSTLFALITLPVEFDASRRGMKLIEKYNLIDDRYIDGAKSVLEAAALTYIAGFVTSLLNLLYYANILSGRKRRN